MVNLLWIMITISVFIIPYSSSQNQSAYSLEFEKHNSPLINPKTTVKGQRSLLIFFNKLSTRSNLALLKKNLVTRFPPSRWNTTIYEINFNDDPAQVLFDYYQKSPFDVVFAVGGDGTISWVVGGLIRFGKKIPLGIIPCGAGNALAQEMDIPSTMKQALKQLSVHLDTSHPKTRNIDIIKAGEKYCTIHVEVGVGASTVEHARKTGKRFLGAFAYLWSAIRALVNHKPTEYLISTEDQRIRIRATELIFANSPSFGLGKKYIWGPHIKLDDGILDVCVIQATKFSHYVQLIIDTIRQRLHKNRHVRYFSFGNPHKPINLSVVDNADIAVQADGDVFCRTPLTITLIPGAISIVG